MPTLEEGLAARIRTEGPLPFHAFMEDALYGAEGYYTRAKPAIGPAGDFVTGSSYSPLFGRATARLLGRLAGQLGQPAELFEAGFGGGEHLAAVVEALDAGNRVRAWDRIAREGPEGAEVVSGLPAIADGEVEGLVFSYELFDALPVNRLVGGEGGEVRELMVAADEDGAFAWTEEPLSRPELADLLGAVELAPGQIADLAPGWASLYRELARKLGRGLLVTCDYGFERERLLDARVRRHGTLASYRRHRVHRDPFRDVGEQDLTAHVDFTALIEAGEAEGLTTVGLTRQALWLLACGVFEDLGGADLTTRHQAATLLDGEGMGQEIRVLVQARGIDAAAVIERSMLLV